MVDLCFMRDRWAISKSPRLPFSPPASAPLPFLSERPDFLLEGPGVARLLIELPIGLRHRGRPHQAIGIEIFDRLGALPVSDELAHPFGVDTGIDHEMGDMDVFGTEFARHRLRDRAQSELGAGKCRKARSATQACRCACEKDVALATGKHQTRGLPAGQETGIAGHLPNLAEN